MDELTRLRRLVADEPMDYEAERAEVWRRLRGVETVRRSHGGRRIALAVAVTFVIVAGTASALAIVVPFAKGRVSRTVDGIRFSFSVPGSNWENGPLESVGDNVPPRTFRARSLFISKSLVYGQEAEAVVFWTGFPDGGEAAPCTKLLSASAGRSTGAIAAAMAKAPGTRVVKRPTRVNVGGRPATHVVISVRKDRGCDPGYFFIWRHGECWGACWLETSVGDTIRVWIVDVDGKRLVIEAATKDSLMAGFGLTSKDVFGRSTDVAQEIRKIIGSIRFE